MCYEGIPSTGGAGAGRGRGTARAGRGIFRCCDDNILSQYTYMYDNDYYFRKERVTQGPGSTEFRNNIISHGVRTAV